MTYRERFDGIMADWIAEAYNINADNWFQDKLLKFIIKHYVGGINQFLDDSPDLEFYYQ